MAVLACFREGKREGIKTNGFLRIAGGRGHQNASVSGSATGAWSIIIAKIVASTGVNGDTGFINFILQAVMTVNVGASEG